MYHARTPHTDRRHRGGGGGGGGSRDFNVTDIVRPTRPVSRVTRRTTFCLFFFSFFFVNKKKLRLFLSSRVYN